MGRKLELLVAAALTVTALGLGIARAEGTPPGSPPATSGAPGLELELNRAEDGEGGACRLTFVLRNATAADLARARYEFVLFDAGGLVARLTTFDFGDLAPARTVVRQFDLASLACAGIGKILVNGPADCGDDVSRGHCRAPLSFTSRTDIAVIR